MAGVYVKVSGWVKDRGGLRVVDRVRVEARLRARVRARV